VKKKEKIIIFMKEGEEKIKKSEKREIIRNVKRENKGRK
jgi:hypothetical protein